MQVKRYEADNIQDALMKIKSDMGPDAIVLSTKKVLGKNNLIEVMAARDNVQETDLLASGKGEKRPAVHCSETGGDILSYLRTEMEELKALIQDAKKERYHEEIAELKESMDALFDVLGFRDRADNNTLSRIYYYLVSRGVSKARACKLLDDMKRNCPAEEMKDYEKSLKTAEELLGRSCRTPTDDVGKRVKVFVGPTGVGKTTTLAKLTARYALEKKLTVGLITTDTYRIAALEQLKVYARIMDLPLQVASEKDQFRQSIDRFHDRDVILVDTPGRGYWDDGSLPKLNDMISGDWERETNLLLSLTSSRANLMDAVSRYGKFSCDHLIFTKLDECHGCGILYDVIEQAGKPVSYITTGQNVPKDIERMNPVRLAELIMWH